MKKTDISAVIVLVLFIRCGNKTGWNDVFHADDAHTGMYQSAGGKNLGAVRWKFKTDDKIFSSPVIMNEIVYFGSADGYLYALELKP